MTEALEVYDAESSSDHRTEVLTARLDQVVLARLATMGRRPAAPAVARELRALAPTSFSDAGWFATIEQSFARIRAPGAPDGPAAARGRRQAMRALGLSAGFTWKRIYNQILPGLGLGVTGADARAHRCLDDHDSWAGAIVARARGIWRQGPPPSWTATCDAVVWAALGLPGKAKATPAEIRAHFLKEIFRSTNQASPSRLLRQIAAREVGALRLDLRSLREALARRWVCGESAAMPRTSRVAPAQSSKVISPDALPLETFATMVRRAASEASEGVFGRRKVFISRLWEQLRAEPAGATSLDEFKRRLVSAHKAGLLTLARADLVAAMDPRDVANSETRHLEARYHFVEREGEP
jgi:hypothetical protein